MRAKRRWNRVNAQILVWAGDERKQLKYDGKPILLPAYNETAKVGPSHPFRFESVRNSQDTLIPGTLEVKDIIQRTPEGGVTKVFDVGDFCDFLERDRERLFESGLEIVSAWQDVPAAMQAARPVWEKSQDARAQQILTTEMDRIARFEAKGQPAPEGSNAERVAWAISHLQKRKAADVARFGKEDIAAVLQGQYLPPKEGVTDETPATTDDMSTIKQILAAAKTYGLKLTRSEMEGLLEGDDEQTEFVLKKIEVRKSQAEASA